MDHHFLVVENVKIVSVVVNVVGGRQVIVAHVGVVHSVVVGPGHPGIHRHHSLVRTDEVHAQGLGRSLSGDGSHQDCSNNLKCEIKS